MGNVSLKSHTWELNLREAEVDQITGEFPYTFPFEFNRAPTALTLKAHTYAMSSQDHSYNLTPKSHTYALTLQGEN